MWNSHAKFVLVLGGKIDVLYTTSANLNQNKRLENFTLFAGGDLPRQGEDLWKLQRPGEGFEGGSFLGRDHTDEILGVEKLLGRAELAAALAGARRGFRSWWMPVAQRDRGYLVPAGTTWSPILNYVHGTGDPWLFDLYKAGLRSRPISR